MNPLDQLIEYTKNYNLKGWTPATSSNFSVRTPATKEQDDVVHITRSGRHKGYLKAEDFMRLTIHGEHIDDGKPSAETFIHLLIYQTFPETKAVLHTHSPNATVLSMAETNNFLGCRDYEIAKAFPNIDTHKVNLQLDIFENDQDIPALCEVIKPKLESMDMPALLIRGHGLYVWGDTLEQADKHLEAVEFLLECERLRRSMR